MLDSGKTKTANPETAKIELGIPARLVVVRLGRLHDGHRQGWPGRQQLAPDGRASAAAPDDDHIEVALCFGQGGQGPSPEEQAGCQGGHPATPVREDCHRHASKGLENPNPSYEPQQAIRLEQYPLDWFDQASMGAQEPFLLGCASAGLPACEVGPKVFPTPTQGLKRGECHRRSVISVGNTIRSIT